jgi:hypothetical protein
VGGGAAASREHVRAGVAHGKVGKGEFADLGPRKLGNQAGGCQKPLKFSVVIADMTKVAMTITGSIKQE